MGSSGEQFDVELLRRLRHTPELFQRIAQQSDLSELHVQQQLRREFPAELVRAAMTLVELRRKAAAKFERAAEMWFDRQSLEQSTAEPVARHKAQRFQQEDQSLVADLCCGIGGDAIALAEQGSVVAADASAARCLMTNWNAEAYGVADRVHAVCADVETLGKLPPLVHIDPDRRTESGKRTRRVEHSRPGIDFLHTLMKRAAGGAIKLSPASNFAGSFDGVEFELISLDGECRECTVWFGDLGEPGLWRATVLPSGESLAGNPLDAFPEQSELQRYVYDPDPAVVRAGLVDLLSDRFLLCRLDAEEEYLTGDDLVDSPFVSAFEVIAELPNNERAIRRFFREHPYQQVEIKCRRIPISADSVRRKLELQGDEPVALIFARISGKARAIVARRI